MTRRLDPWLTRLARRPVPPSPGHRDALEQQLLARFGELHPQFTKESRMPVVTLWRAALTAAVLAAAAGASQAPADYQAEIGKKIEIRSDGPLGPDTLRPALKALEAGGKYYQVRVRGVKEGDAPFTTTIEIFGDTVAMGDVAATIRKAAPATAALPIQVSAIERTLHGDLADKVVRQLAGRRLPPEELAKAIEAEIRAAEPGAKVQIQIERGEGTEDVRGNEAVRVEVTKEVGPDPKPLPPEPPAPPARP